MKQETQEHLSDRGSDRPKAYTIKYKRPRGSRACTVCRARKVRCDAEIHIPCTNCITFGCECSLPETKKKPSVSRDRIRRVRRASEDNPKEVLYERSQSKPSVSESTAHAPLDYRSNEFAVSSVDHHNYSSSLSSNYTSASTSEPMHEISQVSVPPSLRSPYKTRQFIQQRERPFGNGNTNSNPNSSSNSNSNANVNVNKSLFMGQSSVSLMAQKVGQNHLELEVDLFDKFDNKTLDSVELEILKLRGAFLLPSAELALDLIESYFEHVHPLMPVINRTEFMAKYKDPNDSPSLMLLHAVLLCGSRVSNNPLLVDSRGQSDLASHTFFRRAKALYEANYETDPIPIVQTVLLLGSFWEGPEDVTRNSFYWTRVGVSLAQGFGFHRDISTSSSVSQADKKIWRRIWWSLFEKDRNVAIAFGRPATIDLADSDVPMITLDDFIEDDPESGLISPYPVNKTHALYFIHLVKLAEITGIIISHQYTVKSEQMKRLNKSSVIQRCDMLMGIWFNNLPMELQLSLTDPSKQDFYACLLNAQYYNRLYLIHRANLLRMARSSSTDPNNYKYPSWGISFQSARMISIVSKILLDKGLIKYCPVMFVYVLFSSMVMLIYHVDSINPVIASSSSDSLLISKGVLKELEKYWKVVSFLLKLFDRYASDKIKRAGVIERGTIIAEMSERKSTSHYDSARELIPQPSQPVNHSPVLISPMGGHNQLPHTLSHIIHANNHETNATNTTPNIEDLVRQYKKNLNGEEETNNMSNEAAVTLTRSTDTPNSNRTFSDISLVTEKQAPAHTFVENFEPTQLFPIEMGSYPNSRSQSPFVGGVAVKKSTFFDETSTPYPDNNFTKNNNVSGDLFTNFVDSSYINMNLQSHVEDEGYLNNDLRQLFNMQ